MFREQTTTDDRWSVPREMALLAAPLTLFTRFGSFPKGLFAVVGVVGDVRGWVAVESMIALRVGVNTTDDEMR
jgi:hypothetical protein